VILISSGQVSNVPTRWWKNRGNLVIRLPGSFGLPEIFFCRILEKREEKTGSYIFRKQFVVGKKKNRNFRYSFAQVMPNREVFNYREATRFFHHFLHNKLGGQKRT